MLSAGCPGDTTLGAIPTTSVLLRSSVAELTREYPFLAPTME